MRAGPQAFVGLSFGLYRWIIAIRIYLNPRHWGLSVGAAPSPPPRWNLMLGPLGVHTRRVR